MKIFPLSVGGKIALILIAIILGLIWAAMTWPDKFKRIFRKGKSEIVKEEPK